MTKRQAVPLFLQVFRSVHPEQPPFTSHPGSEEATSLIVEGTRGRGGGASMWAGRRSANQPFTGMLMAPLGGGWHGRDIIENGPAMEDTDRGGVGIDARH